MKPSRKSSFLYNGSNSTPTTTVTYTLHKDQTTPDSQTNSTTQIPIQSSSPSPKNAAAAVTKIQSAYRAHTIRKLYRRISSVDSEATQLQNLIQRQETVDAIRREEREKLRMNEALMSLLLRLDSVPGFDPTVRDARRKISRRIVGLQEILDGITEAKVNDYSWTDDNVLWGPSGVLRNWDEVVGEMEEELCRERGGDEMEKFCAQYLGFRCLQRFLRE